MYKRHILIDGYIVVRDSDGLNIPVGDNRYYFEFLDWMKTEGITIDDVPIANPVTDDSREKDLSEAVSAHINQIAMARGYDSTLSIVSYTSSKKLKWKDEAVVFTDWRDNCWQYSYDEFAKMAAGTRTWPTPQEFVLELPLIVWPT
jgi:hypothetical protein